MAVISITITESEIQILAGIPKTVTIETNTPASIFYTFDKTDPTTDSNIYIGALNLPSDSGTVVLKIYATDGVDNSAIITKTYFYDSTGARTPHSKILDLNTYSQNRANSFPFGSEYQPVPVKYGANPGLIVDAPGIPNIPDGYNGAGQQTSGTDLPLSAYDLLFTTTNAKGERGHGIGTLPYKVTVRPQVPPNTSSNTNDRFFNPRSLVIYQDSRETPLDPNIIQLNKQFFSSENPETAKSGALLYNTAFDGSQPTGSFLKAHYNPRENTTTYYYFDSSACRWIISIEPCHLKPSAVTNLSQMVFARDSSKVFKWRPFGSRHLM